jgi:hypothetical protein
VPLAAVVRALHTVLCGKLVSTSPPGTRTTRLCMPRRRRPSPGSLGRVNVPMFTALRRVTVVFVMVEEFYLLGESSQRDGHPGVPLNPWRRPRGHRRRHNGSRVASGAPCETVPPRPHLSHPTSTPSRSSDRSPLPGIIPSKSVVYSVGVMCLGASIAAWKDLTFDPVSYFYLFLTNLFTSLYTVYINVVKKETNLNIWAMLYYNNVTTMPALAVLAWYTGDLQRARECGAPAVLPRRRRFDTGGGVASQSSVRIRFSAGAPVDVLSACVGVWCPSCFHDLSRLPVPLRHPRSGL